MITISPAAPRVVPLTGVNIWYDTDVWSDASIWRDSDIGNTVGISLLLDSGLFSKVYLSGTGMYKLLPTGQAWPKEHEESILKDFIYGLSISLDRMNDAAIENLDLILPGDTGKYLQDWERFLGLPKCPNIEQTLQQRAASVLAMWNISPYSNEEFFVHIGAIFGFDITVSNGTRGGWGIGLEKLATSDFVNLQSYLLQTTDLQVTFSSDVAGIVAGGSNPGGYLIIYHDPGSNRLQCGVGLVVGGTTLLDVPYTPGDIITIRIRANGEVYSNGSLVGICAATVTQDGTSDVMGLYNVDASGNPWAGTIGCTIYDVYLDGVHILPGGESYFYEELTPSTIYPCTQYIGSNPSATPANLLEVHDGTRGDARDVFKIIIGIENPDNAIVFKAGASGAGDRLIEYDFGPIECLINFFKPAHTYIIYEFVYPNATPVEPITTLSTVLTSGTYVPN